MLSAEASNPGARAAVFLRQHWPQDANKRLQSLLDVSEKTAERVLAGQVSKENLERLMSAFGWRFTHFVLEPVVGPAPIDEVIFWMTDTGPRAAISGSAAGIRDALALAPSSVDLVAYGLNSLGWLEATIRGPNLIVRLSDRSADPAAVRYAQAWLLSQAVQSVDIECERQGVAVRQRFDSVRHAVQALDRHAQFAEARDAADDHRWMVERRSLNDVRAPSLQALIRAVNQRGRAPGSAVAAITDLGILSTSSIFRQRGDIFETLHNGNNLGISPTEFVGRNVMDRKDQNYATLIRQHLAEVANDPQGASYHELDIPINGEQWPYQRAAFAEDIDPATGARFIVTCTHLLKQRIAA